MQPPTPTANPRIVDAAKELMAEFDRFIGSGEKFGSITMEIAIQDGAIVKREATSRRLKKF